MNKQRQEVDTTVAYLCWACACVGLCGMHRFYVGKIGSGLLYLFTGGLLGFGQFIDLFFIPGMTRNRNLYLWHQATVESRLNNPNVTLVEKKESDPMLILLKAAAAHNNVLSIGQAMIATELPIDQVEKLLEKAMKQGLVHIDNDDQTGSIRYHFDV
jgi:TM2 domain-containing membrane protein YozV